MTKLNIFVLIVLLASLAASLLATTTPYWVVGTDKNENSISFGLFKFHVNDQSISDSKFGTWVNNYISEKLNGITPRITGSLAFMILTMISLVIGILIFLFGIFRSSLVAFSVAAHLVTLSGLFIVIGITFLTSAIGFLTLQSKIGYGFSYACAWFAMCLDVIGGFFLAYFSHIRFKNEPVPYERQTINGK